jgi:chromosome segregation protein
MRVKSLKIIGFKSFFNKTEISFHEGVNAIVGPNGCGKSNICDAMKWVMGEHSIRQLRGERAEDIIFSGSSDQKPMGMAEVSMILENNGSSFPLKFRDFSELEITRRVFRSGESEFYINQQPCLLKDIRELFMDTGLNPRAYAVIEQGAISEIVNSSPQDLRKLLEEAAGITKYRERKAATQRKITATRDNLERVTDIIHEVTRQVRATRRQASQARKYLTYQEDIKKIEAAIFFHQYEEIRRGWESAAVHHARLSREKDEARSSMSVLEARIEAGRTKLLSAEKDLSEAQESYYRTSGRMEVAENQINYLKERQEDHRHTLRKTVEDLEADENRRQRASDSLGEIEKELKGVSSTLEDKETALKKHREEIQGLTEELEKVAGDLQGHRQGYHTLLARETALSEKITAVETRLKEDEELLGGQAGQEEQLSRQEKELREAREKNQQEQILEKERLSTIVEEIDSLEKRESEARKLLAKTESAIDEDVRLLSESEGRFESLRSVREKGEHLREGARSLLRLAEGNGRPGCPDLIGVLGHLINVEPEYQKAIEALLSERLESVMVRSEGSARGLLENLKKEGSGRGTVVPCGSTPRAPGETVQFPNGGIGPAWEFIDSADETVKVLVKDLLRDVLLVKDFEEAVSLRDRSPGSAPVTFCTLDGDLLHAWGGLTAGNGRTGSKGILEIDGELKRLSSEITAVKARLSKGDSDRVAQKEELSVITARKNDLLSVKSELSRSLESLEFQSERIFQEIEQVSLGMKNLEKEFLMGRQRSKKDRQDLEDTREELEAKKEEKGALISLIQDLEKRLEEMNNRRGKITEAASRQEVDLAASLEKGRSLEERQLRLALEVEELESHLSALEESRAEFSRKIEEMGKEEAAQHTLLEELKTARGKSAREAEHLQDVHRELSDAQGGIEEDLKKIRAGWEESSSRLSSVSVEMAELKTRLEEIHDRALSETGYDLRQEWPEEMEDILSQEAEELEKRGQRLKTRVAGIGPVNMAAVDEITELEERLTFLTDQKKDLEEAIESLSQAIAKINRSSRERFSRTFQTVKEHFSRTFKVLFNGGEAFMSLEEDVDLLEAGVQIYARPPGKKKTKLSLLSGGEKAMTGLALLFALFAARPSPFCLMDEVDAPLDDLNIDRFIHLLNQTISDSQFVLITHNKRTMERADNLVGVTMESPGISKLISVCLHTSN